MSNRNKYFITDQGIKVQAISREQMIEVDRIAMEETGPNLWQMMENAGRNLAELTIELAGNDWNKKEIVVLCGKGNNGAGGICAARHLTNHGANVKIVLADDSDLGEIPLFQKMIYEAAGGKTYSLEEVKEVNPDIILDAIIGYNLFGAPRGILLEMIKWANISNAKIISLDIPSGVDSNTGESEGEFINAYATLTLALPKTGLSIEKTGKLFLGDIGISKNVYKIINVNCSTPFTNGYFVELFK